MKSMQLELETRTCKCGCGNTFKVLPSSKNFYVGKTHEPGYSGPHVGFTMYPRDLNTSSNANPKDPYYHQITVEDKRESPSLEYIDDPEDLL